MDAEPRALRPLIFLTTAFVVMGTAAGAFLFLLARPATSPPAVAGEALETAEATTRELPWPASVAPAERERLEQAFTRLVSPGTPGTGDPQAMLLDAGPAAVPRMLTYLHTVASDPAQPDDPPARLRFVTVEKLLARIRWDLTPSDRPAAKGKNPDGAWVRRTARQWFAWWDRAGAALCR